jgi:hypothetical protein
MVVTEAIVMVTDKLVSHFSLTFARILISTTVLLKISVYTRCDAVRLGLFFTTFQIEIIFNGLGISLNPSVHEY